MSFIYRVFCIVVSLMLVACVSSQAPVKLGAYPSACQIQCQKDFEHCLPLCENSCQTCSLVAKQSTIRSYSHFLNEQYVQGGIISRDLKSYRDPLQCRKITCNCKSDYTICIQSCSGLIQKRLQVALACC